MELPHARGGTTPRTATVYSPSASRRADPYGDQANYSDQVNERLDKFITRGWYLERLADDLRDQAETLDSFN